MTARCAQFAADGRSVTSRRADSAPLSGVSPRTPRVSCGLARKPGFGDGSRDRPNDMRCPVRLGDLITSADGELLIGLRGAGLKRFVGDKLESFPIRSAVDPSAASPGPRCQIQQAAPGPRRRCLDRNRRVGTPSCEGRQGGHVYQRSRPLGQRRLQSFRRSRRQHLVRQRQRTGPLSKAARRHPFDDTRVPRAITPRPCSRPRMAAYG